MTEDGFYSGKPKNSKHFEGFGTLDAQDTAGWSHVGFPR